MNVLLAVVIIALGVIAAVAYFSYIKGFDEGYETGWHHGSQHARNVLDGDKSR